MYDFNALRWFQLIIPTSFVECLSYEQQIACLAKYKQDKLVEGDNITITDNGDGTSTISATGSAAGGSTYTLEKLADAGDDVAKYQLVDTGTHKPVGDVIEIPNQAYDDSALRTLIATLQRNYDSLSTDVEEQTTEINNLKTTKQDKISTASATAVSGDTASASVTFADGQMIFDFTLPKGDKGDTGETGPQGPQGEKGATGPQGPAGPQGATGAIGPQGLPGANGAPGAKGDPGVDGKAATVKVGTVTVTEPGSTVNVVNSGTDTDAVLDFTLPSGVPGETGPQGDTGPQGEKGADGQAATIKIGIVSTVSPDTPAEVENAGTDTDAILNFKIPRGATGPVGPLGPQGDKGDKGDTGEPGAAATIQVGTVFTGDPGSEAIVTNAGSTSAAILNFTIPRGDKGDTGPMGPSGFGTYLEIPNPFTVLGQYQNPTNVLWGSVAAYSHDTTSDEFTYTVDDPRFVVYSFNELLFFIDYGNEFNAGSEDISISRLSITVPTNSSGQTNAEFRAYSNGAVSITNSLNSGCQIGFKYQTRNSYMRQISNIGSGSVSGDIGYVNVNLYDGREYSAPCFLQLLKATDSLPVGTIIPATMLVLRMFADSSFNGCILTLVPSTSLTWSGATGGDRLFKLIF